MRISDWSSDVCSSDLLTQAGVDPPDVAGSAHLPHAVELGETGIAGRIIVGLALHLIAGDHAIVAGDLGDSRRKGIIVGNLAPGDLELGRPDRPLVGTAIK